MQELYHGFLNQKRESCNTTRKKTACPNEGFNIDGHEQRCCYDDEQSTPIFFNCKFHIVLELVNSLKILSVYQDNISILC